MASEQRYPFEIFWSDDDEGFIAIAPDLPGCSAFGSSKVDAINELEIAVELWIQAAQKAGNPVPRPSRVESEYSGKVMLRMPKSLHRKASVAAKQDGASLNQFIVACVSEAIGYKAAFAENMHTLSAGGFFPHAVGVVKNVYLSRITTLQGVTQAVVAFGNTGFNGLYLKPEQPFGVREAIHG